MNGDNILAVNIPNMITVGIMFMGFVILTNLALALYRRASGAAPATNEGGEDA
jgi:hypothetical protein